MEDTPSEMPSAVPQEPEETSAEKLQQKVDRLTQLLKKAKESILDNTSRTKELEFELRQKEEEISIYKSKLSELSRFKPPKSESITEVLTRVKVLDDTYCFINSSHGYFWLNENLLTTKHVLPEILDSRATKKYISDLVSSSVQEWKEKYSKLADKVSVYEENNENLKKLVKELNNQNEDLQKTMKVYKENNIEKVLKKSFSLYEDISEVMLEENLASDKLEAVQKSLNALGGFLAEEESGKVRDHCVMLLKYLFDVAKRLMNARSELKAQDFAWRSTCDSLLKEKEDLRYSLGKIKSESASKASEFSLTVEKIQLETEKKINKMTEELKNKDAELAKGINAGYMKQVLLQFLFTSDPEVKERMLNVISTLLNFSYEDNLKIREKGQSKGIFRKFI